MKRFLTLLGLLLAVTVTLVATSAGAADPLATGNVSFKFDGYCDGMSVTLGTNGIVTGEWNSSCAMCNQYVAVGGTGGLALTQGKLLTLANNGLTYLYTVVRADHTWTHYAFDGTVFNQGTWTECALVNKAAQNATSRSSIQK